MVAELAVDIAGSGAGPGTWVQSGAWPTSVGGGERLGHIPNPLLNRS